MSSITITDGVFGCGEILAKRVSAVLGYRYLGHEALMKAVQRYRLPEAMPTNVLEVEPPWWKRLLENRRVYRIALQAAMCDIAEVATSCAMDVLVRNSFLQYAIY